MIDMNGSIESIMQECDRIAFNEFKGDAEYAYATARDYLRGSGNHSSGKLASKNAKNTISKAHYDSSPINKPFYDDNKDYSRYAKIEARQTHKFIDAERKERKAKAAKNESASIFDTLLDQV